MSSKITNAGKNKWTYLDKYTDTNFHDLPADWNELYIMSMFSSYQAFPTVIVRECLESGVNRICSQIDSSRQVSICIDTANNKIQLEYMNNTSWIKVYYR